MLQLQNLDITHPGCKELVKRNSISVQGQDKYPLRIAINRRGEQTLVHVPNFGGLSGSEDRGGGDNSIQFINFGRVGDKSFEE